MAKEKINTELILFRLDEIKQILDGVVNKVDCHDREIVELKGSVKLFNSFQTWLTVLGTSIATGLAWIINKNK